MEIMKNEKIMEVKWNDLESYFPKMEPVEGGYSDAKRGIITDPNGRRFFIKAGVSEATRGWAQKETRVYDFLKQSGFAHIPQVVAKSDDNASFALEALEATDGWDWTENWNDARVASTLNALDELATITPPVDNPDVITPILSTSPNGWVELSQSEERRVALGQKLISRDLSEIITKIEEFAGSTSNFIFRKEALVHNDVRADNCAWNKHTGEVKLVDWNWLELGDRRTDLAAMLVHIHQSGYDVLERHSDRLNREALHWIAGFWLVAASKPIWQGGNASLRDFQLDSGIVALDLASKLK